LIAVRRAGSGVDESPDAGLFSINEKIERAINADAVRFDRILDRTRHTRQSRLMKHNLCVLDSLFYESIVIYIALDEIEVTGDLFEVFAKAGRQIVDHADPRST